MCSIDSNELDRITTLCFSSGGIMGLSFIGALEAIEAILLSRHGKHAVEDWYGRIDTVVGTSVGSFIATAVAIGFHSDKIHDVLHGGWI